MIDMTMDLKVKDIKGVSHIMTFKKIKNELLADLRRMVMQKKDVQGNDAPENKDSTIIKKGFGHWMFDSGAYVDNAFIATSDNNSATVELSTDTHPKAKEWTYKDIGLFHSQNHCPQFGISNQIKERGAQYRFWLGKDIQYAMRRAPWKKV